MVLNTRCLVQISSALTTMLLLQVDTNNYVEEIRTTIIKVRIIASHFANCTVNSSYCVCKVLICKKWKTIFPKDFCPKVWLIHLIFSHITSKLYPQFMQPMLTIIKLNIAYTQNNIANCNNCYLNCCLLQ